MATNSNGVTVLGNNGTFSGSDMLAHIIFPGRSPIALGQVTTMTYSTYRETHPVRTLGRINVKGFSKGPRTIAGTLIFTVFDKHVVNQVKSEVDYISGIRKLKPCELPPFDIMITFGNEYGASAKIFIYGIEVVDEGKIFSVEDLFTENTWSYMARDIDLMDSIDAEQNAPLISLGELESAGKFKVNSLVMDDDYVKMQAEIDRMKKDKDAAIQAAREQAKDYIASADNWGFEESIIPETSIPGGAGTADQIPVDPDHKNCVKPSLEIYSGFGKPSGAKTGDRVIYFQIDMTDLTSAQQKEAFEYINGTKGSLKRVTLKWKCDGGGSTWSVGFKSNSLSNKKVNAVLLIKDFFKHQPVPVDLTISMSTITLSDGTKITVQKPSEYELKTNDGKTEYKPFVFKLLRDGSKADKKDKEEDKISCDIAFMPYSNILTGSLGRTQRGNWCQYFYRDATGIGYEGVIDAYKRPVTDKAEPNNVPPEDDYITPNESWLTPQRTNEIQERLKNLYGSKMPAKTGIKKNEYVFLNNYDVINAAFHCKVTCKKDGKAMSSTETKGFYLKFDYKIVCMVRGKEVTFDGDQYNTNVTEYKLDQEITSWFRTDKIYKIADLNSGKKRITIWDGDMCFLKNNETQLYAPGIAKTVFDAVHKLHDKKNPPIKTEDTQWYKNLDNCICRFKYSDMTLVLHNFKVCDGINTNAKQLKIDNISGVSTAKELRFPISNMDDRVLKDIIKRCGL